MLKRNAFKNTSEKDLRTTAKTFKFLRWLAPLMFLLMAFFVFPKFVGEEIIFLQIGIIVIGVIDYFMFDRIYKNARDELKDRFGERI